MDFNFCEKYLFLESLVWIEGRFSRGDYEIEMGYKTIYQVQL